MKKYLTIILVILLSLIIVAGCSGTGNETGEEDKTITFGMTNWTSTKAPTAIVKQILEEAGYTVETTLLAQPVIWQGMQNQEIDFFMDAWLPYTEAELWKKYKDDLVKVATSYKNAPLGWVVPTYVEENSIEDLKGNGEKYDNRVVTISPGAGIVDISEDVIKEYGLDEFELFTSSEAAMLADAKSKIQKEEPVVFTGWRPHSMFAMYDLKFLEEPKELFKYDNVYVLSFKGIEEKHPEAYEILSQWSIEVSDLEEMMLRFEQDEVPFEVSAEEWITEHRDQVNKMLGK